MRSCSPPLSHHRALTSLTSEQWLIKTAYRPTWFLCWHVRCFDFESCSSIQTHQGVFSVGSRSRSGEWEAEESGRICWVSRPTLWNSCMNLTINTFFMEVLKPRVEGVGLRQASRPLLMLGWLGGWGWKQDAVHHSFQWTLTYHVHTLLMPLWRCGIFGGLQGLGMEPVALLSPELHRKKPYACMHPSIHHCTTVPPLSSVSN